MSDLIDRQEVLDYIDNMPSELTADGRRMIRRVRLTEYIQDSLPSVQPDQKTGEWIVHPEVKNVYGGTYIECPQCGEKYVVQHMEDEKYCRNCGTKMEV